MLKFVQQNTNDNNDNITKSKGSKVQKKNDTESKQ